MKKILGLAVATLVLVSCKKTNDKVEDATEAIKQKWVRLL
jgi:PBP1b-binding outer membrane lipoprotein LpoB